MIFTTVPMVGNGRD